MRILEKLFSYLFAAGGSFLALKGAYDFWGIR